MILVAAQNTFNQNESLGADFFPHLNFHLLFHIFLPVAAFIQLKVYVRRVIFLEDPQGISMINQ